MPDGHEIIPVINRIQDKFDLVVTTQDWHPANHVSFASNHKDKHPLDEIELDDIKQVLWPDHCVQNTHGAEFHPDLEMTRIEAIFRKGMDWQIDSYSGFYDNGHKKNTGLAGYLRERKAKELFFCGLAADVCVWFSIMDARKEGFSVTLVEDATKPIESDEFIRIKEKMKELEVKKVMADDIE